VTDEPPESEVDLSVVIPAFNEASRLPGAIREVTRYLDGRELSAEVLLVENGSSDETIQIAEGAAAQDGRFQAIHLPERGKGRAVRAGVLASRGRIVAFCDADFSMPVDEMDRLLEEVERGADIAIASREAPGARRIGEPGLRHLQGRVFNGLVRVLAVPGLEDTQCGFKAFRREVAREIFRRQLLTGWAFDVEVLFLARRSGFVIREVPVTWQYDPSSRVRPVHDTIAMMRELLSIRCNALQSKYDM
jgi:glycosyltransferase involved in cell wall biosynthesis